MSSDKRANNVEPFPPGRGQGEGLRGQSSSPAPEASRILGALGAHGLDRLPDDWPAVLDGVSEDDVPSELARPAMPFRLERVRTLIAPAARAFLEPMAQQAAALTRQRFGRVVSLYAPLYVSNVCRNRCRYCGFNAGRGGPRRRLSVDEAAREGEVIAREGFRDLLLVSGEDPQFVSIPYLSELAQRLRGRFCSLSAEIYQFDEPGYRALFDAGIDGITLYQETYDRDTYARMHEAGPKADYDARLIAQEAAARAGMRRLGIGSLLGLQDWRFETLALAVHAHTLMKSFWRAKVSFSFPRIRPAADLPIPLEHPVGDRDLVQMMLALRLSFPDAGLALSTREPAALRDRLVPLGITQISAGSRTNPGGYGEDTASEAQFDVADERSPAEVSAMLRGLGLDPVWKDWDEAFLLKS